MVRTYWRSLVVVGVFGVVFGGCALFDDDPSSEEPPEQNNQVEQNSGEQNEDQQNSGEQNDNGEQNQQQPNTDENVEQENNDEENAGEQNANQENTNQENTNQQSQQNTNQGGGESEADPRVRDMVTAADYGQMVIEVDYVEDQQTRSGVDDRLVGILDEHIDKPDGLEVVFDEQIPEEEPEGGWTFDELQDLVGQYHDLEVDGNTITAYTLLVDGEYADSEGTVLGIAWANRYVVLFMDQIESACQGASIVPGMREELCENAELTVWLHEMGHVLGLVGVGAPTQSEHWDPDSTSHCEHDDCVMYWAFRRPQMVDQLVDRLLGSEPAVPEFDEFCRDDLEAVE